MKSSRSAVVLFNFQAGSTFPVLVCTVSPGHQVNNRTINVNTDPGFAQEKNGSGSGSRLFLKNLLNFFSKAEFSNFLSYFFRLFVCIQKSVHFYFLSYFFKSLDLEIESKHFFCSFWLIFCPLNPAGSRKPKSNGSNESRLGSGS